MPMRAAPLLLALMVAAPLAAQAGGGAGLASAARPAAGAMARIPAGSYTPLYTTDGEAVRVAAFELDRFPVTRAEYREFVRAHPRWRKSAVRPVFTGPHYLADWPADLDFGSAERSPQPVTQLPWFAAKAYCEAQGKRLPTTHEWERAAAASETVRDASRDPAFIQRLVALYTTRRAREPVIGSTFRNAFGVHDLHGLVWEWTLDFNGVMVSDDSRDTGGRDRQLYCAAGVTGATDPTNYPAFLRYAFRAGLTGRSTVENLGFRCARDLR
jgi:formylglycine-generating enzyme